MNCLVHSVRHCDGVGGIYPSRCSGELRAELSEMEVREWTPAAREATSPILQHGTAAFENALIGSLYGYSYNQITRNSSQHGHPQNRSLLPSRYRPIPPILSTPSALLTLHLRPQKHHRRRPPQLPHLAQIQAIAFPHRCPTRPGLQRRHHLRNHILLRLQARLGSDQVIYAMGGTVVLYSE